MSKPTMIIRPRERGGGGGARRARFVMFCRRCRCSRWRRRRRQRLQLRLQQLRQGESSRVAGRRRISVAPPELLVRTRWAVNWRGGHLSFAGGRTRRRRQWRRATRGAQVLMFLARLLLSGSAFGFGAETRRVAPRRKNNFCRQRAAAGRPLAFALTRTANGHQTGGRIQSIGRPPV